MRVAIVGASGLVGQEIFKVLEESNFPVTQLIPVASEKSVGKTLKFKGEDVEIQSLTKALFLKPQITLFSAGSEISKEWAPKFAAAGSYVVDNSSAWRMDPSVKLIVPEVNGHVLQKEDKIIANPNCSTIQMVMVLKPLHDKYGLKRVVVSTYQSVTGTGKLAVDQLMNERNNTLGERAYPHIIDMNALPHIDVFQENGYTKEEMKMILETRKIMGLPDLKITSTAVRIPTIGGHAESINLELNKDFDLKEVRQLLDAQSGVVVQDEPSKNFYPMPITSHGKNDVFVGRIRRDESIENGMNLWVVADNLRKGAATNTVQIAEYLINQKFI